MANHALPTNTSLYTEVISNYKDRIDDVCKMLDPSTTTTTNVPTNAARWNSVGAKWEKFNGTAWSDLTTLYNINVATANNLNGGNNTTLLGSIPYQSNTNVTTLLAPNTVATRKFLRQTGTGTKGAVPVWDTILAADIPTLDQNTTGSAAKLTTARNINGKAFDGTANIEIEDRLGLAIASAGTVTIGTAGLGNTIHITGITTITSLGTAATAGTKRILIFDGALTLTHSVNIVCPGAANIVTIAGTAVEVVADTTTIWKVVNIIHPSLSFTKMGHLSSVTSDLQVQLGSKAPLSSPALTGTPTAPTAAAGTNTEQVATTAFVNSCAIGVNQTWQDVTQNRSAGVIYTNATGKPIFVSITVSGGTGVYRFTVNGVNIGREPGSPTYVTISAIVPAGATYVFTSGGGIIAGWSELRQ